MPDEIGLLHLDWGPHLRDWAGMRQASRTVGAAAADLTILQITNNEGPAGTSAAGADRERVCSRSEREGRGG